jgi:hypothetical protein
MTVAARRDHSESKSTRRLSWHRRDRCILIFADTIDWRFASGRRGRTGIQSRRRVRHSRLARFARWEGCEVPDLARAKVAGDTVTMTITAEVFSMLKGGRQVLWGLVLRRVQGCLGGLWSHKKDRGDQGKRAVSTEPGVLRISRAGKGREILQGDPKQRAGAVTMEECAISE